MNTKHLPMAAFALLLSIPGCSHPQTIEKQLYMLPLDTQEVAKFPHNCLSYQTSFTVQDQNKHGNEVEWQKFRSLYKQGDELWTWQDALPVHNLMEYPHGASSIGLCLIRNNKIFAVFSLGVLTVL